MSDRPDDSLLSAWCSGGSEEAFTALAKRYGGLLYHAAKRRTGREELAGEAAQNALLILARKAPRLRHLPCLSGWLHRTACYEAAKLLRREQRHEARMKHLPTDNAHDAESPWLDAAPLLDEALDALPEKDRQVIFLKYFDGLSFEQMARQFGGEPAAWRQRGSRAVERLRGSLAKRGVAVGAQTIAAGLGSSLTQAAPASFVTAAGTSYAAVAALSWKTLTLHSLYLMKMKPAAVIAAVLLASFIPLGLQAGAIASARQRVAALENSAVAGSPDHPAVPQRRTASVSKPQSGRANLIALADALIAAEQGDALRRLLVEKKLRAMDTDELERLLMECETTEMGSAQRNVLVRGLFREFCRVAEKSKMPCERVVTLATRLAAQTGPRQGSIWNVAGGTIRRWIETDLDAAVAWFREARKSGLLDSPENAPALAGQAFDGLYKRNPAEAQEFYHSLSDADRHAVIGGGGGRGNPELMLGLAAEIGDAHLRGASLAQVFSNSEGKSPQEVRAWLERLQPSPAQTVELLAYAARGQGMQLTTENALARIDWLREASGGADFSQAAGAFLVEAARMDREKIREIIDAEWRRNPDERMLATYLSRSFFSNEGLIVDAIPLSLRITDAGFRDESLRRMLVSTRAPEEARALARKGGLGEEEINRLIPENP